MLYFYTKGNHCVCMYVLLDLQIDVSSHTSNFMAFEPVLNCVNMSVCLVELFADA